MAISEYDYVKVGSGTEETYVPFEDGGYDIMTALDDINGEVVAGGLESKTDYLEETKEQIRAAIISKGESVEESTPFREYAEKVANLGVYGIEKKVVSGVLSQGDNVIDLTGVEDVGDYALRGAYYRNQNALGVALRNATDLVAITGSQAFYQAFESSGITSTGAGSITRVSGELAFFEGFRDTSITTTGFSNLEIVAGDSCFSNAFRGCNQLLTVGMEKLNIIQTSAASAFYYAFYQCLNLEEADFPNLQSVAATEAFRSAFGGYSKLKTVRFGSLRGIWNNVFGTSSGQAFANCRQLKDIYFNSVKSNTFTKPTSHLSALANMFSSTTGADADGGCTVHFPSNLDPENPDKTFDITTLTGYPTFGGSANYIHLAYDLPATE